MEDVKNYEVVGEVADNACQPKPCPYNGNKPTNLSETSNLMASDDYQDRFRAEYLQLKFRIDGLTKMLRGYKGGVLTFKPKCSYDILNGQLKVMALYHDYLIDRAEIEGIDL